jgi:hypothetical protein
VHSLTSRTEFLKHQLPKNIESCVSLNVKSETHVVGNCINPLTIVFFVMQTLTQNLLKANMKPLTLLLVAIGVVVAMPNPAAVPAPEPAPEALPEPMPEAFPEALPDPRVPHQPKCAGLGHNCERMICCRHYSCQAYVRNDNFFFLLKNTKQSQLSESMGC